MAFEFVTVKSSFHGGGIHSKHHTFNAACREAEKWGSTPGLAVAEIGDSGKYYKLDYQKEYGSGGGYCLIGESEEPIKDRVDLPFASAYDYVL